MVINPLWQTKMVRTGKSPYFEWANQRTKWPFSIANVNLPEGRGRTIQKERGN
jgi:hypothetical protein